MRPFSAVFALALLLASHASGATEIITSDICIYGGTSGGIAGAVQARRMGKTVSLAVFGTHLGGLTSGGLGATDVGNTGSIGGISREFYRRIGQRYGQSERFNFEPHIAREVYEAWLAEIGVVPRWNQRLAFVTMAGQRITQMTMEDGTIYRAKMFIDATYEGDLLAMAGVSFTFGREGTNVYGEALNGIRPNTPAHQFTVDVDPYVIPGNPSSGLLPYIQAGDGGMPGDGDNRIQAFNYRMCFTKTATNKLPHVVPPDYDPAKYELLGRLLDARVAAGHTLTMGSFFGISSMPNGKTDMNNNGAFSTDFIGMNWTYPTNSYSAREQLDREHIRYIQGFVQYLATSPRSPAALRAEVLSWGPCKDEWVENGGYSPQIYVREARRMVSDYVMIQGDCQSIRVAPDSVCLGSYNMDSHNCQRVVKNGYVRNEGDVQVGVPKPYPISYRSIVPKKGECENLFATFAISATHIAFGSTRMEPVFMMASQSAATAAAFAINDGVSVQEVDYSKLALQMLADGQVLTWGGSGSTNDGIILDNRDAGAVFTGVWSNSTSQAGFLGSDYAHDNNTNKGAQTATFTPILPKDDVYNVYFRWTTHANRATNVPIDVIHPAGTTTVTVNQTLNNGTWVLLATTNFAAGNGGSLRVRTTGTTGYVIADGARWVSTSALTPVQVIATDPIASETGKMAKVTFIRPAEASSSELNVAYHLDGDAVSGTDFAALSGTVRIPAGSISASMDVQALNDTTPEGDKTILLTILDGAGYGHGSLSNAVIHIMDTPFDGWRFAHFTSQELLEPGISGAGADPDGDGVSNFQEFKAGTEPKDAGSVLRLNIERQAGGALLKFPGLTDRYYTLQCVGDAFGEWFDLTNFPPLSASGTLLYSDRIPDIRTNRFYRVLVP